MVKQTEGSAQIRPILMFLSLFLFALITISQFDYGCVIWNSYYKEKYNEQIEKVQRRATKTLPKLNKLEYIDRLKKLKLPCLKYRRLSPLRGDLIRVPTLFHFLN